MSRRSDYYNAKMPPRTILGNIQRATAIELQNKFKIENCAADFLNHSIFRSIFYLVLASASFFNVTTHVSFYTYSICCLCYFFSYLINERELAKDPEYIKFIENAKKRESKNRRPKPYKTKSAASQGKRKTSIMYFDVNLVSKPKFARNQISELNQKQNINATTGSNLDETINYCIKPDKSMQRNKGKGKIVSQKSMEERRSYLEKKASRNQLSGSLDVKTLDVRNSSVYLANGNNFRGPTNAKNEEQRNKQDPKKSAVKKNMSLFFN